MKFVLPSLLLIGSLVAPAAAQPAPPREPEARITFPGRTTIRTFHPVSNDVVYIQHRNRQWYRAELYGPCFGLRHALGIGVVTRGAVGVLDRYSDLIVDGERCKVASFVKSGPPPERRGPRNRG
jgi:hypothetical protein